MYAIRRRSGGAASKEETNDLTDVLSTQAKSTKSGFKKLVRNVSSWNLSGKKSEAELDKHIVNSPESGGAASTTLLSSEQLADEYRSLLGEHPLQQETSPDLPYGYARQPPYSETATTWSGLVTRAMGMAGADGRGRESRRRRWTRMEMGEGRGGEAEKIGIKKPLGVHYL